MEVDLKMLSVAMRESLKRITVLGKIGRGKLRNEAMKFRLPWDGTVVVYFALSVSMP